MPPAAFRPGSYLTFRLARQDFAVEAARVRAILPAMELVLAQEDSLDQAGTARLRGHEFPVVDLAARLTLAPAPGGRNPSIIVVETAAGLVGFLADTTPGVIEVRQRDFQRERIRAPGRPRRVLDVDSILQPLRRSESR